MIISKNKILFVVSNRKKRRDDSMVYYQAPDQVKPGVYIFKIIYIFVPPPPLSKMIFFPKNSENFLFSPFSSTSYPLYSRFLLIKSSYFFPNQPKLIYIKMKNIHFWVKQCYTPGKHFISTVRFCPKKKFPSQQLYLPPRFY